MSKLLSDINEEEQAVEFNLEDAIQTELDIGLEAAEVESQFNLYDDTQENISLLEDMIETDKLSLEDDNVPKPTAVLSLTTNKVMGNVLGLEAKEVLSLEDSSIKDLLTLSMEEKQDWLKKATEAAKKLFVKINKNVRKIIAKIIGAVQMFKSRAKKLRKEIDAVDGPDGIFNSEDFIKVARTVFMFSALTDDTKNSVPVICKKMLEVNLDDRMNTEIGLTFFDELSDGLSFDMKFKEPKLFKFESIQKINDIIRKESKVGSLPSLADNLIVKAIRFDGAKGQFIYVHDGSIDGIDYGIAKVVIDSDKNAQVMNKEYSKKEVLDLLDFVIAKIDSISDVSNTVFKYVDDVEKEYADYVKNTPDTLNRKLEKRMSILSKVYTLSPKVAFNRVMGIYGGFRSALFIANIALADLKDR